MASHLCGTKYGEPQGRYYSLVFGALLGELQQFLDHGPLAPRVEILPLSEAMTKQHRRFLARWDSSEVTSGVRVLGSRSIEFSRCGEAQLAATVAGTLDQDDFPVESP
jgi:hypothetical protein